MLWILALAKARSAAPISAAISAKRATKASAKINATLEGARQKGSLAASLVRYSPCGDAPPSLLAIRPSASTRDPLQYFNSLLMGSAWRIVLASEAALAFSGEGAWLYGGRWNSPHVRVVYVSQHQSTAAFEVFVNNIPFFPEEKYKAFRLEWPDSLMEDLRVKKWPANWRISPPAAETMEIGDQWVAEQRSAILAVPSAISPNDRNFLLNPAHSDFKRIRIAPPIEYEFDPRLLGR